MGAVSLRPSMGGVIYNYCEQGDIVNEGTLLGILNDTMGRVIEECRAPYKLVILDMRYQLIIYPGDLTYHCGRLA